MKDVFWEPLTLASHFLFLTLRNMSVLFPCEGVCVCDHFSDHFSLVILLLMSFSCFASGSASFLIHFISRFCSVFCAFCTFFHLPSFYCFHLSDLLPFSGFFLHMLFFVIYRHPWTFIVTKGDVSSVVEDTAVYQGRNLFFFKKPNPAASMILMGYDTIKAFFIQKTQQVLCYSTNSICCNRD